MRHSSLAAGFLTCSLALVSGCDDDDDPKDSGVDASIDSGPAQPMDAMIDAYTPGAADASCDQIKVGSCAPSDAGIEVACGPGLTCSGATPVCCGPGPYLDGWGPCIAANAQCPDMPDGGKYTYNNGPGYYTCDESADCDPGSICVAGAFYKPGRNTVTSAYCVLPAELTCSLNFGRPVYAQSQRCRQDCECVLGQTCKSGFCRAQP